MSPSNASASSASSKPSKRATRRSPPDPDADAAGAGQDQLRAVRVRRQRLSQVGADAGHHVDLRAGLGIQLPQRASVGEKQPPAAVGRRQVGQATGEADAARDDRPVRLGSEDLHDEAVGVARHEEPVVRVEGQVVAAGPGPADQLPVPGRDVYPKQLAGPAVEHVQPVLRVELERDRTLEFRGDRFEGAAIDVDPHHLAGGRPRAVQPIVGTPVHAVQAAARTELVRDEARLLDAVRIELEEVVAERALGNEQPAVIRERDRVHAGTGRGDHGGRPVGRALRDIAEGELGPVQRAVRPEDEIVGALHALLGPPTLQDLPALGVERQHLRARRADDMQAPVRTEVHAVRCVQGSALGEDRHRPGGRLRRLRRPATDEQRHADTHAPRAGSDMPR